MWIHEKAAKAEPPQHPTPLGWLLNGKQKNSIHSSQRTGISFWHPGSGSWYQVACRVPNVACHAVSIPFRVKKFRVVSCHKSACRRVRAMSRPPWTHNSCNFSVHRTIGLKLPTWGQEVYILLIRTLQTFWTERNFILRTFILCFKFLRFQIGGFSDSHISRFKAVSWHVSWPTDLRSQRILCGGSGPQSPGDPRN